jgi:hypothetical protein
MKGNQIRRVVTVVCATALSLFCFRRFRGPLDEVAIVKECAVRKLLCLVVKMAWKSRARIRLQILQGRRGKWKVS